MGIIYMRIFDVGILDVRILDGRTFLIDCYVGIIGHGDYWTWGLLDVGTLVHGILGHDDYWMCGLLDVGTFPKY